MRETGRENSPQDADRYFARRKFDHTQSGVNVFKSPAV